MEVLRRYARTRAGIREHICPANRCFTACRSCPRVPDCARPGVPVSYPRSIACSYNRERTRRSRGPVRGGGLQPAGWKSSIGFPEGSRSSRATSRRPGPGRSSRALPSETVTVDMDTTWEGVSASASATTSSRPAHAARRVDVRRRGSACRRGVGPAESAGKPHVTFWPDGTRLGSTSLYAGGRGNPGRRS